MLIEAYEKEHYPIDPPDPIEAIKFRMEQQGLSLGSASKVSEVLSGKRPLSLNMIRKLMQGWVSPMKCSSCELSMRRQFTNQVKRLLLRNRRSPTKQHLMGDEIGYRVTTPGCRY